MAALQERNGSFRILFRYLGKQHTFTLGEVGRDEAETKAAQVDYLLLRIKQKFVRVPPGVSIVEFIQNDGQVTPLVEAVAATATPASFSAFRQRYLDTHRGGSMEANRLQTVEMHLRHFERTFGEKFPVRELTLADLQRHVSERAKKKYRGKPLSPVSLRKEVASLRAAWNWGALNGLTLGLIPSKGLVYPKGDEKPPVQTWAEIERQASGLPEREQVELWECLFLTQTDVAPSLEHARQTAGHGWIYPAVVFAAHTGVRRSEVIRVRLQDLDLEVGTVLIREKKRSRSKRTHRRVPLSPLLAGVLRDWPSSHPDGQYLFCHKGVLQRNKKRSSTTGHQSEKTRASSLKGRMAAVQKRTAAVASALTRDEAHDHFQRLIADSKWAVMRGWHVMRHSFISNCAAKGVDQWLIDAWVGHQTEEMRKRYRHLIPSTEQAAIRTVFE